MNRREFLGMAAGAAVMGATATAKGADTPKRILFGACRGPKDVPLLKKAGFDFWEWNAASAFMPDELDESKWASRRDEILAAPLPIRSSNGFLPGKFRLTGPQADFAPALDYAERVCRRADKVNLKTIVFGSGGARNVPGDFTAKNRADHPDTEQGTAQMTDFCRQLAKRIADCKVVVVIEPLRPKESNIVNFVWQGLHMVEDVGSPRIQQLADIFHMIMGREDAESIVKAGDRLKHCHIATKDKRAYPGANDTEAFLPYFALPLTVRTLWKATAVYRSNPANPPWRGLERASGGIHFLFGVLYAAAIAWFRLCR